MPAHIMNSEFYRNSWGTPEMRAVFDDEKRFDRWLRIEAALARVQAKLGIISPETAAEIDAKAHIANINLETLKAELPRTGHTLMPLLRELQRVCGGGHGEYVHFGAATQDIEDTGLVLEMRDAYRIVLRDVIKMEGLLAALAERYKNLPAMGRAHVQHGSPITLGLKFAVMLAEVRRTIERMKEAKKRLFVCLLHGGVGSQAGLGPKGVEVTRLFAAELGLDVPVTSWAMSRDNVAEYQVLLAFVCGTISRVANEIYQLSRTEILELHEPLGENYVGSSTMPHKRNAEVSEFIVALCRIVSANSQLGFQGMMSEHERDARSWRLDWHGVAESSILTAKALGAINFLLGDLQVYEENIARNMNTLAGQVAAERILLAAGKKIGKQTAHQLTLEAANKARETGTHLRETVTANDKLAACFTAAELDALFDLSTYVGTSVAQVEAALALSNKLAADDAAFLQ